MADVEICITDGSGIIGPYFYDSLAREDHGMRILNLHAPIWDASTAHFVEGEIRTRRYLQTHGEITDP